MKLKTLKDINLKGVNVFLRVDFNVSLNEDGSIEDDFRIRAALPTIKYLIDKKSKIIIGTHLGRPKGKVDLNLSTKKIVSRLSEYVGFEVKYVSDCIGPEVVKSVNLLNDGDILMLENLRFYKEEENDDKGFSSNLANLADIYINDAFSVSHRKHASVHGISKYIPAYAGFLMKKEVEVLSGAYLNPKKPLVVAVGGAKIKTKLKLISRFFDKADSILIGGVAANMMLKLKGVSVGASKLDKDMPDNIDLMSKKINLPIDVVVAKDLSGDSKIKNVGDVGDDEMILDIGPLSVKHFSDIVKEAGTVIWNGPFGYSEMKSFAKGTEVFARALVGSNAFTIVGGGDSIAELDKIGLTNKIDFISTGGGAMLELLAGEPMPGIEPLIAKNKFSIFNIFKKNGKI